MTSDKENQYIPSFSPDGKKIAYVAGTPSDWPAINYRSGPSQLFVVDRDGSNRQQIAFGNEVISWSRWSPDCKRIAYGARSISEPLDSFRTYVVELSNPGSPRYIAQGNPADWFDNTRIQVIHNKIVYLVALDGSQQTKVYDDSTTAFFILGGKYILYNDRHKGKDLGVWIVDGMKPRDVQRKTARLLPWNSRNIVVSGDGKTLYSHRGIGEFWRMQLPNGSEERIKSDFLGVEMSADFSPSWDGKEMLIVKRKYESKIIMIENLFK